MRFLILPKPAVFGVLLFVLGGCQKQTSEVFGVMNIEHVATANSEPFVLRLTDEKQIEKTCFKPGEQIFFCFELSNASKTDTTQWDNYQELTSTSTDFVKIYRGFDALGTPYGRIENLSSKSWKLEPSSMVRFTMSWINSDTARNEYLELIPTNPLNMFLEKGDYSVKVVFPLTYKTSSGVSSTIYCNKVVNFTVGH
jgi:hypothetical protein